MMVLLQKKKHVVYCSFFISVHEDRSNIATFLGVIIIIKQSKKLEISILADHPEIEHFVQG